jgi:hypothetical protein
MLLFSLEDGGSIFLRNISIYLEVHMALVHKTNNGYFSHLRNKCILEKGAEKNIGKIHEVNVKQSQYTNIEEV